LADIQLQTYLSPSKWDKPIFGIGPVFQFPSTTHGEGRHREVERRAIRRPGGATRPVRDRRPRAAPMVVRWRQLSPGCEQLLIQPFVNYNLPGGWFLVPAPIVTANWEADSDHRWVVPLGGGRVFSIGPLPVSAGLQAY
jgi:hypothetical protein